MKNVPGSSFRFVVRLASTLLLLAAPLAAAAGESLAQPIVVRPVRFAETRPLRELVPMLGPKVDDRYLRQLADDEEGREGREINELNSEGTGVAPDPNAPTQRDAALQTRLGPEGVRIPAPSLTFEGLSAADNTTYYGTTVAPSDSNGAVGPNDVVETTNNLVRIWDKNGVPRGAAFKMTAVFAALGGICAVNNQGDPVVLYDRMGDRWLLSQFAYTLTTAPPYHECIAISKSGDPTGAYWAYDYVTPGNNFPDYPKLGAWPDGYYFSDRQFTNGGPFNSFGVMAFDRAKMMVGDPTAAFIYFDLGAPMPLLSNSSSGMIPTDFQGLTPPPAGAPNVLAVYTDDIFGDPADAVRLFNFHADFASPPSSSLIERAESPLAVPAFDSRNPTGRADIEEPPPAIASDSLDSIGDRLMFRMQYLNRGGTESLILVQTVNGGTIPATPVLPTRAEYRAAPRYYELRKTAPGNPWAVNESATFAPADTLERFMGSAAMDNAGNLAVGYTGSSTTVFPSLVYAGRLAGDAPGGLFQGEATMFAGIGVQRVTSNRWGDYSSLTLDPADDATFWYVNQYYASSPTTGFDWHTRIGRFKFDNTTAPAQGTLAGTITACDSGLPLADSVVQADGGPSAGYSGTTIADGTYSKNLAPGDYQVSIFNPAHSCDPIGPFPDTITDGNTTVQDGCLTGAPKFALAGTAVSGGNGDSVIDADECVTLDLDLTNIGCLIASGVTAQLSTSTPEVTITQPNTTFATMNEDATTAAQVPFSVSTSASFVCGTQINFTLTVSSPLGGSIALPFTLPSCVLPPFQVSGALVTGDLLQNLRLGRNGIQSACPNLKANPGTLGTGNHLYDLYTLINGPTATCARIDLTPSCPSATNAIISVAYLGSFNPANIAQNYLGDPGGSPSTGSTASFSVPLAANATLAVNVHVIPDGAVECSGYNLSVSDMVGSTTGVGPCAPCAIGAANDVTVGNDLAQCGAVVNYSPPSTSGTCGNLTCDIPSGSFFPVGTTAVTCSTTAGPTESFNVTVNDTEPPTVTAPTLTVPTDPGVCDAVVNFTAPSADNCSGAGTATCVQPSGSTFPLGANPVTCSVSDDSGNPGQSTGTITVEDQEAPVIACPADISADVPPGQEQQAVTFADPGLTDNCPGASASCVPPSGSLFDLGTTTDTCSATDGSGNRATCSFAVTLRGLSILEIPTLSRIGLAALALLLGVTSLLVLLRIRKP